MLMFIKLCDVDLEVTSMETEIKINEDTAFLHPVHHDGYSMPSRNQYENKLCIYMKVLTRINAQCVNVYVHTCVYSQQCLCDDITGIIIDVVAVWKKKKSEA